MPSVSDDYQSQQRQGIFCIQSALSQIFVYTGWLLKEIFKSTYDVCKVIMKPGTDYVPRIVYFSMPYENPMASVILANSIILTPGTVTIDVTDDGIFEVHALNKTAADDMLSGTMPRKVAWVFGETCEFVPLPEMEITDIMWRDCNDSVFYGLSYRYNSPDTAYACPVVQKYGSVQQIHRHISHVHQCNTNTRSYRFYRRKKEMYVDIAISYAVLGFISSVIVAKILGTKGGRNGH